MGKTVIIGAGAAGLSAGIYCRLAGLDCTVIEKNKFTGGNLTGWERSGFEIDNCMHWLNGTRRGTGYNDMWRTVGMLGDDVPIIRSDAFYSSEYNGKRLSLWRDPDRTLSDMLSVSPEDAAETEKFITTVKTFSANPEGITASKAIGCLYYGRMSLRGLADKFRNEAIKRLITDYFGYDLSAITLVFAYASFAAGDADVPAGGSRTAAKRMEKRYLELGGRLITGCRAGRISLSDGKAVGVTLSDGRFITADRIILSCDPKTAFGKLLPEKYMPLAMKMALGDTKHTPVFSALHAAFSCDATDELPSNTVVFDISPINFDGRRVGRMIIKPYYSSHCRVPEGKAVLQTIFYLYADEASGWIKLSQDKKAYGELKAKFGNAVKSRILKRFPSLSKSLKLLDVWTPATYRRYFGENRGAFLSFATLPGRALIYRAPSRVRGLENVYLASQWQNSPGGLPVAASNGKAAARLAAADAAKEAREAYARRIPLKDY